ncbi:MAG: hypothetical protein LBI84_01290 [Propionibacteriaceae bacterium]|jgi:hypothetical protein|nr:hypothetical protein [Propionibacteriaceae bacterium]
MAHRRRPRDIAAGLLGLLCLVVAAGAVIQVIGGLAFAVIQIAAPAILIALAVLALLGLRR